MNLSLRLATALLLLPGWAPSPASAQIDAPFVPTPDPVAEAMLELAGVTAADTVLDLGSGDGRLVLAAAARGAFGVGIELREDLVEHARRSAREQGLADRTRFVTGDILDGDWGAPSVVLLYLSPALMQVLGPRLRAELPAGTRVVSHAFPIPAWAPEREVTAHRSDGRTTRLFLWVVDADPGPPASHRPPTSDLRAPASGRGTRVAHAAAISRPSG